MKRFEAEDVQWGGEASTEISLRAMRPLAAIKRDFLTEKFNSNGKYVLAGAIAASILGFLGSPLLPAVVAGAFVTGFGRYNAEEIPFWENAEMYGRWKPLRGTCEMQRFDGSVASANHQVMDSLCVAAGIVAGATLGIASAESWFVAGGGAVLLGFIGFVAGKIASCAATPITLGVLTAAEFVAKDVPKRLLFGAQHRLPPPPDEPDSFSDTPSRPRSDMRGLAPR